MPSKDSMVRDLLDKLRDAPPQELSEVVDFVERLRAKRSAASTGADESARRVRLERYTTWTEGELQEIQAGLASSPLTTASEGDPTGIVSG
jgi:hypothetical protein